MIKTKVDLICSACGTDQHKWHEVYCVDGIKLKKAQKPYISWCKKGNGYVIETYEI